MLEIVGGDLSMNRSFERTFEESSKTEIKPFTSGVPFLASSSELLEFSTGTLIFYVGEMEKAVALFTNPEFSIKELTNSLYLDILMIKQCFQATFILLNNKCNNQSRICPTNLFILKDNQQINVSSLLTSNSSHSITSWTYSPFNINNHNHIDWLPKFFIYQTPLLMNIPIDLMNSTNITNRWLIYFKLSIEIDEKKHNKYLTNQLMISLQPNIIMNSFMNMSSCWYSSKIIINLQNIHNQRIDLNLFAYTSDDLLVNHYDPNNDPNDDLNNHDDNITIHLNVHVMNSSNSCLLHLYNPLIFSFHNFIHNYYNLENYFSLMLLKSIDYFPLWCIYPFYKQWTIQSNKFDPHLIVAKQQLMINNLEVKLNKFCTWNVYKFNKHLLYLITNGIFNGICLYVNMNWCISNPIIIEIRSSSRKLLNLLDQLLFTQNNVDEFHFVPYNQSLLESDISNKTINVQKSITDSFNCLIHETEYLINQITQLIECTMYKRIPELSVFLKDLTNNLDIAHRSAEWRSIVNKASTIPIDNILSNFEYCQLRLQTDVHFKNLCFINNF
ncbi:unnamed protein product [Schistosoma margrebowiei]|uniref:DHC_N1 domain-containing protein n=1 Tax=Schistosoma margrebowiei TaxID=48269 RepID=A0AA84ZDB6_9TREM|nr:unnamed protein product [Schistosoma margrebowiei]